MTKPAPQHAAQPQLQRVLGFWDATSIIIGMVIGSGIFRTPASIAEHVQNVWTIGGLWIAGGIMALAGSLCYAELATAYPESGGDYHYLKRAYGTWAGFLFGWINTFVVRTGTIASVCMVASYYLVDLCRLPLGTTPYCAMIFIVFFSAINIVGTRHGAVCMNVLTVGKIFGIALITIVGILFGHWISWSAEAVQSGRAFDEGKNWGAMGLAFIAVMWTYGGWNEVVMVAGEVKHPEKNLLRSLIVGTVFITSIYLFAVVAYHSVLTPAEILANREQGIQVATAVMEHALQGMAGSEAQRWAGMIVAGIVLVSALGGANGYIMGGGRILHAFGKDMPGLRFMHRVHPRYLTPAAALAFQMVFSCLLVLYGEFEKLIVFTGFGSWLLSLMTAVAIVILRYKDADRPRPYKVYLPVVWPIFFLGCCILFGATIYDFHAGQDAQWWLGPAILVSGLVFYITVARHRNLNLPEKNCE